MSFISEIFDQVNKRGKTFIVRLKQDVDTKSRSGSTKLAQSIKGSGRIEGTRILWEGTANDYWAFFDEGVKGTNRLGKGTHSTTGRFNFNSNKKSINLDAVKRFTGLTNKSAVYAIGASIHSKGLKKTLAFTNAIKDFKLDLDLSNIITKEIIKK